MKKRRGFGFVDCLLALSLAMLGTFGAVGVIKNAHQSVVGHKERMIARNLITLVQTWPLHRLEQIGEQAFDRYGLPVTDAGKYWLKIEVTRNGAHHQYEGALTYKDHRGALRALTFSRSHWGNHE